MQLQPREGSTRDDESREAEAADSRRRSFLDHVAGLGDRATSRVDVKPIRPDRSNAPASDEVKCREDGIILRNLPPPTCGIFGGLVRIGRIRDALDDDGPRRRLVIIGRVRDARALHLGGEELAVERQQFLLHGAGSDDHVAGRQAAEMEPWVVGPEGVQAAGIQSASGFAPSTSSASLAADFAASAHQAA